MAMLLRRLVTIGGAAAIAVAMTLALGQPAHAMDKALTPRIVGGVPADTATTRWFALMNPIVNADSYVCGGTILSSGWILTAAHCVTTEDGTPQSSTDIADSGTYVNPASLDSLGPRVGWSSVVVNPGWNPTLGTGDVALVQTSSAMSAPAMPYSSDTSGPRSGTALQVVGYGATSYGGALSPILRLANLIDVGGINGSCGQYGQWFHVANQVCAGIPNGAADACQGDSGGPLSAIAGSNRVVIGVVSFGVGCGDPSYPGVYSRVSTYSAWIRATTGVAPDATLVGVRSPARLIISKPCSSRTCALKRGGSLLIHLRNAGGTAANYNVTGRRLRIAAPNGSVRSGATASVRLTVSVRSKFCATVTVSGSGAPNLTFKVRVNGGRC